MAAPLFSLPRPAYHSPHIFTAAWRNRYAIAIPAIGQVIPYHGFVPAPAPWMRQGIFCLCGDRGNHRVCACSSLRIRAGDTTLNLKSP